MKKYLMMLAAAALIASAPIYYAMTAQAEEAATTQAADAPVEITIDCTKATLDGEEVPAECEAVKAEEPATAPVEEKAAE